MFIVLSVFLMLFFIAIMWHSNWNLLHNNLRSSRGATDGRTGCTANCCTEYSAALASHVVTNRSTGCTTYCATKHRTSVNGIGVHAGRKKQGYCQGFFHAFSEIRVICKNVTSISLVHRDFSSLLRLSVIGIA